MARFFVRQPDGRFALFSTVVDDFHESGLTAPAMRSLAANDLRLSGADLEAIVSAAERDTPVWDGENRDDGLNRWRETLARIMKCSGPMVVSERMLEMGLDDTHVPVETWALAGQRH